MISPRFRSLAAPALVLGAAFGLCWTTLALERAALVRPVAYPDADRLVDLLASPRDRPTVRQSLYPADVVALRASRSLVDLAAYTPTAEVVWRGEGEARRLQAHRVEPAFFAALRVAPAAGRYFALAADGDDERVAVLSEALARSLAGSPAAAIGRRLELDGESFTAIGVFPAGYGVRGGVPDLFLPLRLGAEAADDRRAAALGVVARLADGVTLDGARAELAAFAPRLAVAGDPGAGRSLSLEPLAAVMTRALRPPVRLALLAGLCGLAFAALSAALALTLRSRGRDRERAVRIALGARPVDLLRREAAEIATLAAATVALALAVARIALALLPDLGGRWLHRGVVPRLDLASGLEIAALAAAAALAAGLPALVRAQAMTRRDPFRAAARFLRHAPGERALVASQVAIAAALAAVAVTAGAALARLERAPLGYAAERVLSLRLAQPGNAAPLDDARLVEGLAGVAEVAATGVSNVLPGDGWGFHPETAAAGERALDWSFELVDRGYFAALGLPLLAGRAFEATDRAGSMPVAVINAAARRELAAAPLGARFSFDGREDRLEIVGVVGDALAGPGEPARPIAYILRDQRPALLASASFRPRRLFLRVAGDPAAAAGAIRSALAALAPDAVVDEVEPLDHRLDRALLGPRLLSSGLALHAALAVGIGLASLASLLRLVLARRRRELAIRVALGATAGRLRLDLLRDTAALAAVGALAGGPVGALLLRAAARAGLEVAAPGATIVLAVGGAAVAVAAAVAWRIAGGALGAAPADWLRNETE